MIAEHDADGNGVLHFEEFVEMMGPIFFPHAATRQQRVRKSLRSLHSASSLRSVGSMSGHMETKAFFEMVDADQNGYVTIDELRHAWASMDEHMSESELEEMLQQGDHDEDGKINLQEFIKMFG